MITVNIRETDEFIKLGQALKKAGLVESGVDAKFFIQDGQVKLNGETELQRGKKLYNGDVVSFNGETIQIVKHTIGHAAEKLGNADRPDRAEGGGARGEKLLPASAHGPDGRSSPKAGKRSGPGGGGRDQRGIVSLWRRGLTGPPAVLPRLSY